MTPRAEDEFDRQAASVLFWLFVAALIGLAVLMGLVALW